jgi:hypothetical protein
MLELQQVSKTALIPSLIEGRLNVILNSKASWLLRNKKYTKKAGNKIP